MFHWWEGIVAGFAATVGMTALMELGTAVGMTRMNMAVMLGSMFRRDADSARVLGAVLHFTIGLGFGFLYAGAWWAFDPAIENAWWLGLIFGAVHALVAMAVMPLMSAMHPRVRRAGNVGAPRAGEVVLPPFGFGGRGFGSMTPVGILVGHLVFGLVWGLLFWWLV